MPDAMRAKLRRRKPLRFGVRVKVILVLLSGLVVSVILSTVLLQREQASQINAEINQHGTQVAKILSRSLANSVVGYDYHAIQLFLDDTIQIPQVNYLRVVSAKGNEMASAKNAGTDLTTLRRFEENIQINGAIIGKVFVGIDTAPTVSKIEEHGKQLVLRRLGAISFILLIELIAISYFILRPLTVIATTLARNVGGNGVLPEAIPLQSNDELGDIAQQFNLMRDQLNDANRALQGKIEYADNKLREANQHLINKSFELEKINQVLQTQAITDPLTGLSNRREFQLLMNKQMPIMLTQGETLAVLLIDIDHFKLINDKYGHEIGDSVLHEIANRLSENRRKTDKICRIGGEEFFILCRNIAPTDVFGVGEKLRRMIQDHPVVTHGHSIEVTVSIGIASTNMQDENLVFLHEQPSNILYRKADLALYHSKATGRNRVVCYSDLPQDETHQLTG